MKHLFLCLLFFPCLPVFTQSVDGKKSGVQIIASGGKTADSLFIHLLGNADAKVIFIPTAASSLRSDAGTIWNPDEEKNKTESYRIC
jgi:hypothetical protein